MRRAELVYAAMGALPYIPVFEEFDERRITPRFNVAPSQSVPIVTQKNDRRLLTFADWGFVPFWAKEKPKVRPINARGETVATGPAFRQAFQTSRCLIPADGFYEWQPGTPKQPYFFHRPDDKIFAFAGLFNSSDSATTCLLITTSPNAIVKNVHNRMPVMLSENDYQTWLDPKTKVDQLQNLIRPYPDDQLTSQAVGQTVNRPSNDGPECIECINSL